MDLVSHVNIIALAGALYVAFSPYNRILALVAMLWREAEGTILAFNEVNNGVLLAVAQRLVSATAAEEVTLVALGRLLIVAEDWGFKTGLALLALGSLLFGILFVTSRAVPSALGWWGLVAGLLAVVGTWVALLSLDVPSVLRAASFLPIILFELVFGIWLPFRGGQIGVS